MNIEEAIDSYLKGHATVSALAGERGYPMTISQKAAGLPAYAYQVISHNEIMDHDGLSKIRTVRVQFTCQAGSYEASKELARAIGDALRGYKGVMGSGVFVETGQVLNEFDGYGSVGDVFVVRVDVALMYRVETAAYDWYVDSVLGSDSYDGKTPSTAFATIAKLLVGMKAGDSVSFAKGSTWLETYTSPGIGCVAVTHGSGSAPIFDCRDVAANASFTKTGGQTNVYQIAVSPDLAASGTWNSVWEGSTRLVRATSIANCDVTPGSYYPSSDTVAPITMYVHASDSSSPITNENVYRYSKRRYSFESYDYTNNGINGVVGIGNLGESGSFRIGKSSILVSCQALEGNKHNIHTRDGCYLESVTASKAYYNPASPSKSYFVYNEDTPAGLGMSFVNCAVDNGGVLDSNAEGFYGHYNISGSFGAVLVSGCTVADCGVACSMTHCTSLAITNCTISNCNAGLAAYVNTTVTGGTWTVVGWTGRLVSIGAAGVTVTANGLTGTHSEHGFYSSVATGTFILTNCTTTCSVAGSSVYMAGITSNILTANGNRFTSANSTVYQFGNANYTYTGDNNNYKPTGTMYANAWYTWAEWQALVAPQDANSTVG